MQFRIFHPNYSRAYHRPLYIVPPYIILCSFNPLLHEIKILYWLIGLHTPILAAFKILDYVKALY